MKIQDELWHAYLAPFFRFRSDWLAQQYWIITAYNPLSQPLPAAENKLRLQHLMNDLGDLDCALVEVGDKTFSWVETSIATVCSEALVKELANKYQQNAVYSVQDGSLFLVSCVDDRREQIGNMSDRQFSPQ